jgi:hypothetical protein
MKFEIEHWPNYFGKYTLSRMIKGYIKTYIFLSILLLNILFPCLIFAQEVPSIEKLQKDPNILWMGKVTLDYVMDYNPR